MDSTVNLLALETSGKSGSVSLLRARNTSESTTAISCESEAMSADAGSAKTLAPAIKRLLTRLEIRTTDLSAIALITGPGSFTGLRVGVATAKAMAYALQIPTIEVDTLDAIALQIPPLYPEIHVVLDAYRGQVFYARYKLVATDGVLSTYVKQSATEIVDIQPLLNRITENPSGPASVVCGPGSDRLKRFLADEENATKEHAKQITDRIRWLDGPETYPTAESVAKLGFQRFLKGETLDAFHVQPKYFRGSAAEEMLAKSSRV